MLGIERRAWGLVITSAILQVLIFPLANLYPLSWIAISPLLVSLLNARRPRALQFEGRVRLLPARPWQGFLLGYVCGFLCYGGSCYWVYSTMQHYGGISGPGAAGLLLLFCLYLGLYHGVFGLLSSIVAKLSVRSALVATPFIWVAVEFARTRISGFPWDLLGIAQVDNVPLAGIARVTGVYGISFEIMVVNVAFAAAFVVRRNRRNSLLLAATAAAFVLQIARWMPIAELPAEHSAVLVQENIPVLDNSDWTRQYYSETLAELSRLSRNLPNGERLRRSPDLIVWPESPAPFYSSDLSFRDVLSDVARSSHSWIVAGNIGLGNPGGALGASAQVFNAAALVSAAGEWAAEYDKIHLVPFGEYVPFKPWLAFAGGLTKEVGDFSRGVSRAPLQAGDKKLGVFICYESIFPDEVRQFAQQGAQVFVNISNDGWYGDSGAYAQHLKQARMRAIENDRWLLRDTNTGVTASIDAYGRVVASVPRKVRTALLAPYSLISETTFYTRHGDWLAYACAIISLGAIVVALTPAKGKFTT
jgi:apolipoprotein N-acyltransferase